MYYIYMVYIYILWYVFFRTANMARSIAGRAIPAELDLRPGGWALVPGLIEENNCRKPCSLP